MFVKKYNNLTFILVARETSQYSAYNALRLKQLSTANFTSPALAKYGLSCKLYCIVTELERLVELILHKQALKQTLSSSSAFPASLEVLLYLTAKEHNTVARIILHF